MRSALPSACLGMAIQLQSRLPGRDVPVVSLDDLPAVEGSAFPGCSGSFSCGPALEGALDEAFAAGGLGVLCVTGGEAFAERVQGLREGLLPLALALERLPEQAKEPLRERGTLNVNGYSQGLDGNRSGIYFHPATDTPGELLPAGEEAHAAFYAPNQWPDKDLPELRPRAREAAPFLVEVGRRLAAAVDRRCEERVPGYRPGTLSRLVREPTTCNHKCRLILYHEYEDESQRAAAKGMWAPPHKDTCLLTVLVPGVFLATAGGGRLDECPDPEVGLYVRDLRGAVTHISAPPGVGECLFFQVGEALQVVSGGLFHATEHCVRGPPGPLAGYARASMAVFLQPHAHEELPLPEGSSFAEVAARACDGLFRMFLLYQPQGARGINFLDFCQREGF